MKISEFYLKIYNNKTKKNHPDINSIRTEACREHLGLPSEPENSFNEAVFNIK